MCFVFIWEQTATCATYSINWLVFITEIKSVYSAVRAGSLNKAVCASSLRGPSSKCWLYGQLHRIANGKSLFSLLTFKTKNVTFWMYYVRKAYCSYYPCHTDVAPFYISKAPRNCCFTYLRVQFNPLKPELNPICYLLALLAHHFLHVSRIRVKSLTLRWLMSYIYGAPILDVSRSHTTTQHSR